jgi:hypothetical protein
MTNSELFEEYLNGKLAGDETTGFEKRLREDETFAREFELYRTTQTDMQQWEQTGAAREQLTQTLKKITGRNGKQTPVRPLRFYLLRIAAVAILVPVLWMLFKGSDKDSRKSEKELYADYAGGEKISGTRSANTDRLWDSVGGLFYDAKYGEAIKPLQQVIATGADSLQQATVYLGYCFMQIDSVAAAENIFKRGDIKPGEVKERAQWYLALLYLKTKRKTQCIEMLNGLSVSGNRYKEKAAALLKELQ